MRPAVVPGVPVLTFGAENLTIQSSFPCGALHGIQDNPLVWGVYPWVMFDFAADRRHEADRHCLNNKASIPRTPGSYRIMAIGGHPDDADIICSCTAANDKEGCRVKFVAACNGDLGHHVHSREKVAAIRRQETLNAAKVLGLDSYDIYGWGDARCPNTIEAREMVVRKIQEFEPDIVMTHRDCDYHVDHRTIGTLVKDCGYMLGCPHWIEGSKPLRRRPLILLMSDIFTVPRVMRPDILVDADPYIGKWADALDCQVLQFYEWLAWDKGVEDEVAAIGDRKANIAGRNAYLMKYRGNRKVGWRNAEIGTNLGRTLEMFLEFCIRIPRSSISA